MNAPAETKHFPIIQLQNVLKPIDQASGLGNTFYTDDQYFRTERDAVLGREWMCIGFEDDVSRKSSVKPIDFMGLPLLLMRNREGVLQVFHNVCSHRGMKLVHEAGDIQGVIRCQYHSWTYDTNGALKGTPHVGGINQHKDERFACEKHGLKAIRSHVWMGMVFVNLSGDAPDFDQVVKPLVDRWQPFLGADGLSKINVSPDSGAWSIEVGCNWKLAVENYCEAYHLPWVHPSLNSYSRLEDHYNIAFGEQFAGQGSYAYNLADVEGTSLPTFPAWPADRMRNAEYVAFFPNVLLGIQADHAFAMMLQPLSANRTVEHLRLFFVGKEAAQDVNFAASRQAVLNAWRVVFSEDIGAVEGMQAGRQSPGFRGGVFSPEMDAPTHYFHQWMARKVLAADQQS